MEDTMNPSNPSSLNVTQDSLKDSKDSGSESDHTEDHHIHIRKGLRKSISMSSLADDSKLPKEPIFKFNRGAVGFFALSALNALGVVYGDIGTSPLYALKTIFEDHDPKVPIDKDLVKGAICLIIYSLTWVVCVKYLIFVLRADYRGEGGIFALVSLLLHEKDNSNQLARSASSYKLEELSVSNENSANMPPVDQHAHSDHSDDNKSEFDDTRSVHSKHDLIEDDENHHHHYSTESIDKLKKSKFLKKPTVRRFYSNLALIGCGLLLGDGVITPSISVLSALEGLELFGDSVTPAIVPVTCIIIFGLFSVQRFGTAKVGLLFGPIMGLWFAALAAIGIYRLSQNVEGFESLNPRYGWEFYTKQGEKGWKLMGAVVLSVTGCEAMYADMGHFGKNAVRASWLAVVYPALILNYLGQGSLLMSDPSALENPFYRAVPDALYIPMIILATLATIIASQALISGAFSVTQQAISLGTFPRMKVVHTSDKVEGQIYIPSLNYMLMIVCIILVVSFKSSTALSNAYGLAVCADMTLTTLFYQSVSLMRWKWHIAPWIILTALFLIVDFSFLSATLLKIPYGGYVPLIIAFVVSFIMYTWREGRLKVHHKMKEDQFPFPILQQRIKEKKLKRFRGVSIFMTGISEGVPLPLCQLVDHIPYVTKTIIFLSIKYQHIPYVKREKHVVVEPLPEKGFYRAIARYGYRETQISMEELLEQIGEHIPKWHAKIEDVCFYLSTENIRSDKTRWLGHRLYIKLYNFLHHSSFSAARYFRIPHKSEIVLGTEITM